MSERMYTDEELCWATQVAYCNITQLMLEQYWRDNKGEYPTLQEIFSSYENPYDLYFDQNIIAGDNEGDWLVMQNEAKAFIDRVKAGTICQGWRIVEVSKDTDQKENGFYAVTIQTGEEDAIVSFRGSEAVDINQIVEDWVVADFTMIGSELTEQEVLASNYLYNAIQSTDYDNFAVTGHSLGGNLALVSTVMTRVTDKGTGTNAADRIKQAVSFDGPGHPTEFIDTYRTEINEMAGVMTHYQWSLVGAILTSLCEENGTYFKKESDKLQSGVMSLVLKHFVESLEFDENGMLSNGEFDPLANVVHGITNDIDNEKAVQDFLTSLINLIAVDGENLCDFLEVPDSENAKNFRNKYFQVMADIALTAVYLNDPVAWHERFSGKETPLQSLKDSMEEYFVALKEFYVDELGQGLGDAFSEHTNALIEMVREIPGFISWTGDKCEEEITDRMPFVGTLKRINQVIDEASAVKKADPLVFDLDGDGFEILDVEDGVYFDEDNSGLAEKTQWVDSDDALLALDLNGDGVINDGSELFGSSTVLADGSLAKTGFEALAQYDSNGDMVIDGQDEMFSKMLLWQDVNTDGISQANELYTLEEVGVESISLHSDASSGVNSADVTMADGTVTRMGEFAFAAELYNTKGENMEISEEIQGLPNVQAMGRVDSLHNLMQLDESGVLKEYVTAFTQAATMEEREQLVTDILYFITGANDVAEGSRGREFDAKKLTVIERVMGRDRIAC